MHTFLSSPITVFAVTMAIRDARLSTGLIVALSVFCIAVIGFAFRGEFRRGQR